MVTYLSMLRGINVGGKKVPMAELREVYEALKYKNVRTYIQSGNVLFDTKATDEDALSATLEKKITARFGFEVPVVIRTEKELAAVLKKNPFLKEKNLQEDKLYITFLAEIPSKELLEKIRVPEGSGDQFQVSGKEIYLYCPGGYGETKLSNSFFEKKLKLKATTRNWRTSNELLKMMAV